MQNAHYRTPIAQAQQHKIHPYPMPQIARYTNTINLA
jgi:hypothetical protein